MLILSNQCEGNLLPALTLLICAAVSAAVEITQYYADIGLCEADDVVSNGLGGLTGAAIAAA